MSPTESEFSAREAELYQQRISWGLESEGILDRSLVPSQQITDNLENLTNRVCAPQPEHMALSRTDLPRWHRAIFKGVGGPVGRFRSEHDGKIGFAVMVLDQNEDSLIPLRVDTCPAPLITESLDSAFEAYATKAADGSDAFLTIAELWRDVVKIHPFADGNTRTSLVLLQAALRQLGKPRFLIRPNDWEFTAARSYAFRPDAKQSIEPFAALIKRRVRMFE